MSTCVVTPDRTNNRTVYLGKTPVSLTKLSEEAGVTVSMLSHIFSGRRSPGLRTARAISRALGLSTDELMSSLDRAA